MERMDRAVVVALLGLFAAGGVAAWAPVVYLNAGAFGILFALSADLGLLLASWGIVQRLLGGLAPRERRAAFGFAFLVYGVLSSPIWWPGITAARFGLTVVGLLPVPGFDLIFDVDLHPHLRAKTHLYRAEELAPYLEQGPEVIVLGVGWSSAVKLSPEISKLRVPVEALPSGEAISRWRALVGQGRRVIFVLHSTC